MSVTCADERIAPRVHLLSFRLPGASLFPREDEPAYALAAVLFFSKIATHYNETRVVIADHGLLGNEGFYGCGMLEIEKEQSRLTKALSAETSLTPEEMSEYLRRLKLYDLKNLGGIGRHAAWEVSKLDSLQKQFKLKSKLGKILPNDLEKEKIPNERIVITQPFVSQRGLMENKNDKAESYSGSTIIHTITGIPNLKEDYVLTNELLLFGYLKGDTVREILVLEPIVGQFEQTPKRQFLQQVQQTLDYIIEQASREIAPIVNLGIEECNQYLKGIKATVNGCLYGSDSKQMERARAITMEVKALGLLPEKVKYKYGIVDVRGKIVQLKEC